MNTKERSPAGLLAQFERAATRKGREQSGTFTIEGIRLHERALRAGTPPAHVILSTTFSRDPEPRIQHLLSGLAEAGSRLTVLSQETVAALTQGRKLGQIVGLLPLPEPRSLAQLIAGERAPLLLVAADVVDPGNTGALLRTAHAAGATALVAVGRSDPFHPRAARTSRGSLFKLPLAGYPDLPSLLADCQQLGITTVGTAVSGGERLPQAQFAPMGTAVFMGNEFWGLDDTTRAALDLRVTIPMAAGVDSYAVNAAAAILLYEVRRQWFVSRKS